MKMLVLMVFSEGGVEIEKVVVEIFEKIFKVYFELVIGF